MDSTTYVMSLHDESKCCDEAKWGEESPCNMPRLMGKASEKISCPSAVLTFTTPAALA
jgi:hypothetical protein